MLNMLAAINAHLRINPLPLRTLLPSTGKALSDLVHTMLAKRPALRPASATAVAVTAFPAAAAAAVDSRAKPSCLCFTPIRPHATASTCRLEHECRGAAHGVPLCRSRLPTSQRT